jgi:hypothetical protein
VSLGQGGGGAGVLEGCVNVEVAIQWIARELVPVCPVGILLVLSSKTHVMLLCANLLMIHNRQ